MLYYILGVIIIFIGLLPLVLFPALLKKQKNWNSFSRTMYLSMLIILGLGFFIDYSNLSPSFPMVISLCGTCLAITGKGCSGKEKRKILEVKYLSLIIGGYSFILSLINNIDTSTQKSLYASCLFLLLTLVILTAKTIFPEKVKRKSPSN